MELTRKLSYAARVLPAYAWQRMARGTPKGRIHLVLAVADHFEPAIDPSSGKARVPYVEQERRVAAWCRDYPRQVNEWRDHEGRPFVHTYFCPAEQYDEAFSDRLVEHCRQGWGEIEIHLHHGVGRPDTAQNTRRQLEMFRDVLAHRHGCLSYERGIETPRYAFVHGNFALANSNGGRGCGVDSEMQILAETGCYADMTLPAAVFHRSQTAKINSLYECAGRLDERAPQRWGRDLECGRPPQVLPLIVQGPLQLDVRSSRKLRVENGAINQGCPLSLRRLQLWKRAATTVKGRPDWLFVKLHCHGMNPTQADEVMGPPMQRFLRELVEGAEERGEVLHFVTAREMVNIILAACDGRTGNPGDYRDYRFIRNSASDQPARSSCEEALRA
jgi:hypothetical protein